MYHQCGIVSVVIIVTSLEQSWGCADPIWLDDPLRVEIAQACTFLGVGEHLVVVGPESSVRSLAVRL